VELRHRQGEMEVFNSLDPLLSKGNARTENGLDEKPHTASKSFMKTNMDSAVSWLFRKYSHANILLQMENALNEGIQYMQIQQLLIVINTLIWLSTTSVSKSARISVGLFIMTIAIQGLTLLLNQKSVHHSKDTLRFAFRESPQFLFMDITKKAETNIMALSAVSILVMAVQFENDIMLFLYGLLAGLVWSASRAKDQYIRYSMNIVVFAGFFWMKYCLVKNTTFNMNYYQLEVPVNLSLLYALYGYIDYLIAIVFFPAYLLLLFVQYEIDPDKIMEKGDELSNYTLEEFMQTFASRSMCRVYFSAVDKKMDKKMETSNTSNRIF
jgi:hypothetical protein